MRATSAYAVLSILMHLEILFLLNKPADAPGKYSSLQVATVLANVYLELLICLDFSLERYKYDVPEFTSSIVRYAFAGSALMWLLALVDLANVVDASTSAEVLVPFGAGIFLFPFYVALTTSRMLRVGILKPDVDHHQNAYELDLEEEP
ncbi:hypothetical protein EXIGLDRAFT_763681 [Exidia glandulosa HHB12029]|uniref:Uncharacterized protein n=1 Tax=Exidia glandulosa HHB12029 TaxID=1314781 RepID=A0A165LQN6_EXIGL|nr:hypothetical protein EXIGLDRAFT_763681 [Exidia glandulosa HHB12029]